MHFLLLGASGRTGQQVVTELLSQGHTAVALVRKADSLEPRTGLTIVTGTPLKPSDIESALSAGGPPPSAAIMTLSSVRTSESPFAARLTPPRFMADSCANACAVLKRAGIQRIVVLSSAGAGDSWARMPWLNKAFLGWTNIKYTLEDHNILDREIRQTKGVDWTLVRPVRLVFDTPLTPADAAKAANAPDMDTLGSAGVGMRLSDSARVSSVARFLVKVAVQGLYIKAAVVVRD